MPRAPTRHSTRTPLRETGAAFSLFGDPGSSMRGRRRRPGGSMRGRCARSSSASPGRTAPTWRSCSSGRATRSPGPPGTRTCRSFGNLARLGIRDRVRLLSVAPNDFRSIAHGARPGRAGRGLQPLRPELGRPLLRAAGRDDGEHLHRDAEPARGDPLHEADDPLLQRGLGRVLRRHARRARGRGHAVPAAQPVRGREGGRALRGRELPRGLRPASRATASSSTTSRRCGRSGS